MKKLVLFIFLIVLAILVASCTQTIVSTGPSGGDKQSSGSSGKCTSLKTSSGEFLYTAQDAGAHFGDSWVDNGLDTAIPVCLFSVSRTDGPLYNINIQEMSAGVFEDVLKIYRGELAMPAGVPTFNYKEVQNLGDQAIFQYSEASISDNALSLLYVKKGNKVVAIGCAIGLGSGCSEEDFVSIGQTIASRM